MLKWYTFAELVYICCVEDPNELTAYHSRIDGAVLPHGVSTKSLNYTDSWEKIVTKK